MAKQKSASVRIYNRSKQLIALHVRPPGGDFYATEQQIRINPGQDVELPESHLMMDQIRNLQKQGILQIVSNTQ